MNETGPLTIECPFRRPAPDGRLGDLALCGLLQEFTNVEDTSLCTVRSDACKSCCMWFRPSAEHINPVVASLLYNLSSRILEQDGVAGCTRENAVRLNQLASDNIPAEDDNVSVAEETRGQANVDCPDLGSILPRPKRRSGPRVTKWAVGVTTAPRSQPTLEVCLASMMSAGWDAPRLFVDGEVVIPVTASNLPTTNRNPQMGAWPNYYLALAELLMRTPQADAYMLVQDDVVFFQHPGLRAYLETILWPGSRPGLVSLFCSRAYTHAKAGWHELKDALVWGGQAIIFSGEAAMSFLSDSHVVQHRLSSGGRGLANIDWLIGEWALRVGVPVYLPTPSLAQHVGHVSALWPNVRAYGNRRSDRFAGAPSSPGKIRG